jgi:hypothetical protein
MLEVTQERIGQPETLVIAREVRIEVGGKVVVELLYPSKSGNREELYAANGPITVDTVTPINGRPGQTSKDTAPKRRRRAAKA